MVEETFLRTFLNLENAPEEEGTLPWLLRVCHHVLEQSLPRAPELSFDLLDEVLADEVRRIEPVSSSTDPEHKFTLWREQRGCMTAVVNGLSPGERAAFTLANILGLDDEAGAVSLGVGKSAFKVQRSRAQKKVTDHLVARCEHLRSSNPCSCPARLERVPGGGAGGVSHNGDRPAERFARMDTGPLIEDAPLRDVQAIYRGLPQPQPPDDLMETLVAKLDQGEWDALLDKRQRDSA